MKKVKDPYGNKLAPMLLRIDARDAFGRITNARLLHNDEVLRDVSTGDKMETFVVWVSPRDVKPISKGES